MLSLLLALMQLFTFYEKKDFVVLLHGWDSTASRLEPLWGGSLIFPIKFPEIAGTHLWSTSEGQIPKSDPKKGISVSV